MKRMLIVFSVLIMSCQSKVEKPKTVSDSTVNIQVDTITNVILLPCPSADSLMAVLSAEEKKMDSLKTELFLSDLRIEKVKYYTGIVDRNPSQIKFLRGWIRRAVQ